MSIVLLHLSDIHIRSDKDWIIDKGQRIAACTYSLLPEATTVFVVASGDIAFSGSDVEYNAARRLFEDIKTAILSEKAVPVHFVFAPGNHDCNFRLTNKARTLTLNGVRNDPSQFDESVIELGASVQDAYRKFEASMVTPGETRAGDALLTSHRFTVDGHEVSFDCINVSWCSNLHEEPGSLIFPVERYQRQLSAPAELRVAVLHHPLNWFSQSTYHPFRKLIRTAANVVISGHEHVGGVGEDIHTSSGHSAYIEGCVLQSDKPATDSSFNIAILNLDDGTYRSSRFQWAEDSGLYATTEEGSWTDFRSLPQKARSELDISASFEQQISDPGGAFKAHGSPITLADLFIYPDMHEQLEGTDTKRILNTSILQDVGRLEGGVLMVGEEKVGSTSLMYMLYRSFHERGLLPLYVRGVDVRGSTERDIDTALRKAVALQYGENAWERFSQSPSTRKVLLLDDFDDGPIKGAAQRAAQLTAVASRFRYFAVCTSELFDFDGVVRPHAQDDLKALTEYRLLPFGYVKRAQLVKRWFSLTASDGTLDDASFLARCDQAERMLDAVMARNIVPALPLYLLTLLQSLDAGASGNFDESGLGEYYDFLVREGLSAAGVPRNKWGNVIEYCSHLAWQMHLTEHKELSYDELLEFNERYSRDEVRVKLDQRLEELLRARILSRTGDYVRFRYHYIYYFLKGRYIESQLQVNDQAVQAHIRDCCAHLYVRENANTILFLAHHAFKNPMFLECVIEALNGPFKGATPVTFSDGDSGALADFVRELPNLKYSGEKPEEARERMQRRRDENDDGSDGLVDSKKDGAEHDYIAQMISLFKTVEILGQILKNQTAGVSRARRVELLKLLFNGPLRAIRAFFEMFMNDKEALVAEISEILSTKMPQETDSNRRNTMARKILAHILQSAAFGMVLKAVTSISSESLQEDIDTAAKETNTAAARLIAVGTRLDSPKDLPRVEMKKLLDESTTDFVASRVLQMLALRRLYMFKTTERDRQWLASEKLLDIKAQQAIEFRTRKVKALK